MPKASYEELKALLAAEREIVDSQEIRLSVLSSVEERAKRIEENLRQSEANSVFYRRLIKVLVEALEVRAMMKPKA